MARLIADSRISLEGGSMSNFDDTNPQNENAALNSGVCSSNGSNDKPKRNPPDNKWQRVLRYFVNGGSLNRFEAEREVHDHSLNSTVSTTLQNGFGVRIDRQWERVPCLGGCATTDVKRYRLNDDPDNVSRAKALLGIRDEAPQ
jgi:hypothetical protein